MIQTPMGIQDINGLHERDKMSKHIIVHTFDRACNAQGKKETIKTINNIHAQCEVSFPNE